MALDFETLIPKIDRIIDLLKSEYRRAPGSILTEDDLKCLLHTKLRRLPALRKRVPTQDRHVLGCSVHAELSWYDENWKLRIKPDITIIEPKYLSILHGYRPPTLDLFNSAFGPPRRERRLPSKQYEFGGRAITFELKFAREGINDTMLGLIKKDYRKMMRLFDILDRRGEGDTIFSYLVIFDKHRRRRGDPLAGFLREHGAGPRHKIIYVTAGLTSPPYPVFSAFS